DVLLALARLRHDCRQLDEADALLDELLAAHPGHPRALTERGRVALRRGDAGQAERAARAATEAAPGDREAVGVLALALEAQGKADEARQCRDRIDRIELEQDRLPRLMDRARAAPDDLGARYDLGVALLRSGHTAEASVVLRGVLARDPAHAA